MTEKLCISRVKNGEYDSIIAMMLRQSFKDETILGEIMRATRGHENPKIVEERIAYLKAKGD